MFVTDKTVFVVPAFESRPRVDVPPDKPSLLSGVRSGTIRPFYLVRCDKCHRHTDYGRWYK